MRKVISFALIWLSILSFLPAPQLKAAPSSPLTFAPSLTPIGLQTSGIISMQVNVTYASNANGEIFDLMLFDGKRRMAYVAQSLLPGQSVQSPVCRFYVTEEELGTPKTFTATWMQGDIERSTTFFVTVPKLQDAASATIVSTPKSVKTQAGQPITIACKVVNVGAVTLQDLLVTDGALGVVGKSDRLPPGATWTFEYKATLIVNFISKPTLCANISDQTISVVAPPQTITVFAPHLDLDLKLSKNNVRAGSNIKLSGTIKNTGTCNLKNLTVTIEGFGVAGSFSSLAMGKTAQLNDSFTAKDTRDLKLNFSALDDNGNTLVLPSTYLPLRIETPPEDYNLDLSLKSANIQIAKPGNVTVQLTLQNTGKANSKLENIRIMDQNLGNIGGVEVLDVGKKATLNLTIPVESTSDLVLYALVNIADGSELTFKAPTLHVDVKNTPISSNPSRVPVLLTSGFGNLKSLYAKCVAIVFFLILAMLIMVAVHFSLRHGHIPQHLKRGKKRPRVGTLR